jgi:hypothetical protein
MDYAKKLLRLSVEYFQLSTSPLSGRSSYLIPNAVYRSGNNGKESQILITSGNGKGKQLSQVTHDKTTVRSRYGLYSVVRDINALIYLHSKSPTSSVAIDPFCNPLPSTTRTWHRSS